MLHITVVQHENGDRQTPNVQGKNRLSEKKENQYKNLEVTLTVCHTLLCYIQEADFVILQNHSNWINILKVFMK